MYILFNPVINKYYTGFTTIGVETRIGQHHTGYYKNKFTNSDKNWALYLEIECETIDQARKMERHIKSMKSRKYIENLKSYPEMVEGLKRRFR